MIGTLLAIFSQFSREIRENMAQRERTFIMIKPDGVQRGIVGDIIKRFEQKGFKLVGIKTMQAAVEHLQKHYSALSSKPFFNDLVQYMHSGPVVPMASEEHLKKHYADLATKPFFAGLCKFMASGPVVPMVWEGKGAVLTGRKMLGETDPAKSLPGTIRGDYCIEVGRNICHGSDSVDSAEKEIALWFDKSELTTWQPAEEGWVYE